MWFEDRYYFEGVPGVGYSAVNDRVVENVCECSYTEGVEVFKVDVRYVVGTY